MNNWMNFPIEIGDQIVSQPIPPRYYAYQDTPTHLPTVTYDVVDINRCHLPISLDITVERLVGGKKERTTISITDLFHLNSGKFELSKTIKYEKPVSKIYVNCIKQPDGSFIFQE